jgi:hypothetical protein
MNKLHMVGEMGVAVEMVGWQQGLVEAGEVERKVRLVMESEEGRELRARASVHKEAAARGLGRRRLVACGVRPVLVGRGRPAGSGSHHGRSVSSYIHVTVSSSTL